MKFNLISASALKCFVGLDDNINELDCAPLFETPLCVNASSIRGVTFSCNHKAAVQKFASGAEDNGCKDILTGKSKVIYTYCVCNSDLCNSASYHDRNEQYGEKTKMTSKSSCNLSGMSCYEIFIIVIVSFLVNIINMNII